MNCEWCYVPFEAPAAREEVVASLVRRIADLRFTSLTVSGGDPFQYRFLPAILQLAKSRHLFVHVDTHGKSLRESSENLHLIRSTVDLLGFPVDGPSPAVHDLMRGSPGHFNLVARRLRWLRPLHHRLKVNTVVSALNVHNLVELSTLVAAYQPSRWSLYQYWPLGPAARVETRHSLPDSDFATFAEQVRPAFLDNATVVEINPRESRRDTYPIIHHDGEVFVHATYPENAFIPLGSLFEADTMKRIRSHCESDRPSANTRYLGRGE